MTAVIYETAAPLRVGAYANDDVTASRVDLGLRRFLASDAVTNDLYDDLETVLGQDAVRLSPEDIAAIADRLRKVTPTLEYVVERLLKPYPAQMDAAMALSSEMPGQQGVHGHLVRFASTILTVLDLMGEIAELREDDTS
ncbi:hypothetical protein ABCR94_37400 [Streptomyces sp. 21So2-11]|uniref:hypothetical protein n=1 Tax=Streptomyces sp. 21So2-11 TaxID=3144408 RepID=UPI00321B3ED2